MEEEKLTALEAKFIGLKKKMSEQGQKRPSDEQNPKNGNTKKQKTAKHRPPFDKEVPSDSEKHKPKMWNKKKWYFCDTKTGGKCDGKWRCHKPSDCMGKMHLKDKKKGAKEKGKSVVIKEALNEVLDGGYKSD